MSVSLDTAFLDALSSKAPLPAGGSATAYAGAMAASLVAMVARTTIGKRGYAEVEARMVEMVEAAEALRAKLEQAVAADSAAFSGWIAARRTGDPAVLEQAAQHAASVPLCTAESALRVLELAIVAAEIGNRNATSDASAAASLAQTTIFVSCLNVRVNASLLMDRGVADTLQARSQIIEARAGELWSRLPAILSDRLGVD